MGFRSPTAPFVFRPTKGLMGWGEKYQKPLSYGLFSNLPSSRILPNSKILFAFSTLFSVFRCLSLCSKIGIVVFGKVLYYFLSGTVKRRRKALTKGSRCGKKLKFVFLSSWIMRGTITFPFFGMDLSQNLSLTGITFDSSSFLFEW